VTEYLPLERLIQPAPLRRAADGSFPILSMTMHEGLVDQADKFKKRVASTNISQYKVVSRNQLVVGFPIDEGVLSFQNLYNEAVVSPAYDIWDLKNGEVDSRYLERYLRSPRALAFYAAKLRGTTARRRTLPDDIFLSLQVPLPALREQRRIVEVLDRAEALRVKRRAALAQLDTLTQSIFLDLFGGPAIGPRGLRRSRLEQVCKSSDDIKCGPFGTQLAKSEVTTQGVPLWGIRNVNALFELATHEFLAPKTATRLAQYSLRPGDIVMTRKGTVGNCAVYPENFPAGIMHSDLLRIRVDRSICEPIFLSHQLHYSGDVERQLALISGGAVMPGINVTKLKILGVVIPPLTLQQDFALRVAAIEKLKKAHRASLAELDALFAVLQHRAFRGEL
jgi:type I restriction enzyme S subunit